jgi:peptidoglycan-N-acetylglucosamine deacetylase
MNPEDGTAPKKNLALPIIAFLLFATLGFVIFRFNAISDYLNNTKTASSRDIASVPKIIADTLEPLKYKKTIYLTFDDGPNSGSRIISKILEQEQIKSSLFIIGLHVYYDEINYRTYNTIKNCKWIELANHSYTHAFKNRFDYFYEQTDSAVKDFQKCEDSIHFTTNISRTPGRNIWRMDSITFSDNRKSNRTADSLHNSGFSMMGWDLEWHYNKRRKLIETDSTIMRQIETLFAEKGHLRTPDHLVILAHDITFNNTEDSTQLHRLIQNLKAKNEYNFEFVSRYPRSKREKGIKGK